MTDVFLGRPGASGTPDLAGTRLPRRGLHKRASRLRTIAKAQISLCADRSWLKSGSMDLYSSILSLNGPRYPRLPHILTSTMHAPGRFPAQ